MARLSCAILIPCTAARQRQHLPSPSSPYGRYKLEFDSVDVWFRVMRKHKNVYLWLVDAGAETKANFMLMASKAAIAPSRIIFGDRAGFGEHIQVL
jgi:predicted O-linked N-acetylglucosamine transferase (SPINDLY family)